MDTCHADDQTTTTNGVCKHVIQAVPLAGARFNEESNAEEQMSRAWGIGIPSAICFEEGRAE